ncbi:hypothetical protein GALMADRAFT_258252 [Galerina marginata CBS 339.88]|uniref:Uncharacterized protein n=1 Tax=Galerina marginata (strain CBS 339.88) TaxID=685588 RepID=A0A067SIN6_GALM3|nr:hypothetical protein GALMADRAFT_258252 [Galerina marginata CBS 339.88]
MSNELPLHLFGTQAFLPALLSYIRNLASSTSLPLDHVIFQSILLCLIAGDKHLILRTPEEDVGLTVKLAVWVSQIPQTPPLSQLFDPSTVILVGI